MRRQGASATIFERRALPGGLNTYGVAEYKLRASESLHEVEMIRDMGVEFRFGISIDSEKTLQALEAEFDLIFIGVGLGAMQRLCIPGDETDGVMNALELIAAYKTGHLRELGGTVVVVGAGNTAIDAASAALRLGAETVFMLYRRSEALEICQEAVALLPESVEALTNLGNVLRELGRIASLRGRGEAVSEAEELGWKPVDSMRTEWAQQERRRASWVPAPDLQLTVRT